MADLRQEWLDRMTSMHGLDDEDIIEISELFFSSYDESAVEMDNAITSGNVSEFVRLIHGIRGAAANIGFDEICGLASTLEEQGKANNIIDYKSQMNRITDCVNWARKNLGI